MNNNKLKVYLDTSVVSYLQQDDAPDAMASTHKLWQKFKSGIYDIFISQVTLKEINGCKANKIQYLKISQ